MNTTKYKPAFGMEILEFSFTVPMNFNPETQIDCFVGKIQITMKEKIRYLNPNLKSINFSKTRDKLIPGKAYKMALYPILSMAENEDCIDFLNEKKSLLVGAQGLTLIIELLTENFLPLEKWIVAIEEKNNAFFDGKDHLMLMVRKYFNGNLHYDLAPAEGQWYNVHYLLGVFPLF